MFALISSILIHCYRWFVSKYWKLLPYIDKWWVFLDVNVIATLMDSLKVFNICLTYVLFYMWKLLPLYKFEFIDSLIDSKYQASSFIPVLALNFTHISVNSFRHWLGGNPLLPWSSVITFWPVTIDSQIWTPSIPTWLIVNVDFFSKFICIAILIKC